MPKPSDLMSVAFTPSPGLAQLIGPEPVPPPAAMKAVLRHVAEHQLWLIPGQSFRADAALRKALGAFFDVLESFSIEDLVKDRPDMRSLLGIDLLPRFAAATSTAPARLS